MSSFTYWSPQWTRICSPCPTLHSDQKPLEGTAVLWRCCCWARQDSMMSSGSRGWKIKPNETKTVDLQIISCLSTKVLFFSPLCKSQTPILDYLLLLDVVFDSICGEGLLPAVRKTCKPKAKLLSVKIWITVIPDPQGAGLTWKTIPDCCCSQLTSC